MRVWDAKLKKEGDLWRVSYRAAGEDFRAVLDLIKDIPGRRWDANSKTWLIPDNANISGLLRCGFKTIDPLVDLTIAKSIPNKEPSKLEHPDVQQWKSIKIDEALFPRLFTKQIDDLKFFKWNGGNALLVGEVGYGKTVSGLSWLKLCPELRPALVITRAGIKSQWQRQWGVWVNDGTLPEVLSGETPFDLNPSKSYIINREILHHWEPALMNVKLKCVIVDECQDFGNLKAKKSVKGTDEDGNEITKSVNTPVLRTNAMRRIARNVESKIFLSATPFNSKVQQFFTTLNLLAPTVFDNDWKYFMRYCDPKPGRFGGWDFSGASNLTELHNKASRFMLFRDRERTNSTKMYSVLLDTEMNAKERQAEIDSVSTWSMDGDLETALHNLEKLSSSQYKYKSKSVVQWIKSVIDTGDQIVIFGRHRAVLESIAAALGKKGALYYGSTSDTARKKAIEDFTAGRILALVANVEAAGVGLDGLQHSCHRVAFAEVPTNPSEARQCIGRVDRTGQKHDVSAVYLAGQGTADELALTVLKSRWGILDAVRHGTPWDDKNAVKIGVEKWQANRRKSL